MLVGESKLSKKGWALESEMEMGAMYVWAEIHGCKDCAIYL